MLLELTRQEKKIFDKLNTPKKIQDFLENIPINFEEGGETCLSPHRVLVENRAHCFEGALLAAALLMHHGERPLLMDLKSTDDDEDHVVALFRNNGRWGSLSKTNHAVLRYREPIYKNTRELALSFFHEYFRDDGRKTLRSYSLPLNLSKFNRLNWVTDEKSLWYLVEALDRSPHRPIVSKSQIAKMRRADPIEIKAGKITVWKPRS